MALGGGAELVMSASAVVVHAELYMGLVEVGVGLVPAGGGCAEMLRRLVNPLARRGSDDVLVGLQKAFENIATAKVSGSAKEAKALGLLADTDKIVMNRDHLLGEAKALALALSADLRAARAGAGLRGWARCLRRLAARHCGLPRRPVMPANMTP